MRSKQWIQTYTGRQFWPFDPTSADVDVRDIAHALSLLCRFNGHCLRFYSVAEHCVRVSQVLPDEYALWGLMHDAAEAYLSDIPRPIKSLVVNFEQVEDQLLGTILSRFGLTLPMPELVRQADDALLATEARDIMAKPPAPWGLLATPLADIITPMTCQDAEHAFLTRFTDLTGSHPATNPIGVCKR